MFRRTALAVTAGAVALSGAALLLPRPADAASELVASELVASVDSPRQRLLTAEQRQQLRSTGHVLVTRDTAKHGTVTVLLQRGEVLAISATSIRLKSKDGYTHTYVVSDRTKVRERRQPVELSDVNVGERAMVIAVRTDKGDLARRISCLRA